MCLEWIPHNERRAGSSGNDSQYPVVVFRPPFFTLSLWGPHSRRTSCYFSTPQLRRGRGGARWAAASPAVPLATHFHHTTDRTTYLFSRACMQFLPPILPSSFFFYYFERAAGHIFRLNLHRKELIATSTPPAGPHQYLYNYFPAAARATRG